jgi:hypothetical protein
MVQLIDKRERTHTRTAHHRTRTLGSSDDTPRPHERAVTSEAVPKSLWILQEKAGEGSGRTGAGWASVLPSNWMGWRGIRALQEGSDRAMINRLAIYRIFDSKRNFVFFLLYSHA